MNNVQGILAFTMPSKYMVSDTVSISPITNKYELTANQYQTLMETDSLTSMI